MRSWHSLLWIVVLAACNGGKDDPTDDAPPVDGDADTDADSDADTDVEPCESSIVAVDPPPNATMVPLDAVVTVEFDVPVPSDGHYALTLDDGSGEIAGTTELATDRLSMTFTPDAPLLPETTYTIEAEVCDATESGDFTTLPEPVDPAAVEGNTYALRWNDLTLTEPGNPNLLQQLVEVDFILLQIATIDPVTLAADSLATIGTDDGSGNAIPECDVVVQQTADFSLNPYFVFTGDLEFVIDEYGTTADVEDFELQARLASDASEITDVRVRGLVATEQFMDGEDCVNGGLVQLLQPTCVPCTISKTGQCMVIEGNAASALLQPALDIEMTCGL